MIPKETLILDSRNLITRLVDLAKAGMLTPERLEAIAARVDGHLEELQERFDASADLKLSMQGLQARMDAHASAITGLPVCSMTYRGKFAVIEGGRQ